MASVDELAAHAQTAKLKAEETRAPATAVSDGAGEAASMVAAAKASAIELGAALAALSFQTKASQAHAIGERLEGLTARLHAVKDNADSLAAELAGIDNEFESVLGEIEAHKES